MQVPLIVVVVEGDGDAERFVTQQRHPATDHESARGNVERKTWQEPSTQILVWRPRALFITAGPVNRASTISLSQRNGTRTRLTILPIICRRSTLFLSATSPERKTPKAKAWMEASILVAQGNRHFAQETISASADAAQRVPCGKAT
jgi:hypothetical protein